LLVGGMNFSLASNGLGLFNCWVIVVTSHTVFKLMLLAIL
jgi:hypothetical protein